MYDELVRCLRHCVDAPEHRGCGANCKYGKEHPLNYLCISVMMLEAADAVAKQNKLIDAQLDIIKQYQAYLDKYRWIPVTERLPDKEKEIYWCYTNMGIMCECRWTNNRFGVGESDKWGWNIMDVPQYQKVTHWMPLPTPPTAEEGNVDVE